MLGVFAGNNASGVILREEKKVEKAESNPKK